MAQELFDILIKIAIVIFLMYLIILWRDKDEKKREDLVEKGIPVPPRSMQEADQMVKENVAAFKEKYPNYQEQFTDEMVEEIIRGYVHLSKFGYQMKYDTLVENGTISHEWFNRILPFCVQKYASDKIRR